MFHHYLVHKKSNDAKTYVTQFLKYYYNQVTSFNEICDEWKELDTKGKILVQKCFLIRRLHRGLLRRIWDREVRIMISVYGGKTSKKNVKKWKSYYQQIKAIKKTTREIFLCEWYFLCKVRLKRAIDLE